VSQFLSRVSRAIVENAKTTRRGIILERLKGIRYAPRHGGSRTKSSRRRLALWPFSQLQHQIEYKARWEGVPIEYVSPTWTTGTCHRCKFLNHRLKPSDREWRCPSCGAILDRDVNAAINIERRGKTLCLAEVRPEAQGR
jgi:putative transposase